MGLSEISMHWHNTTYLLLAGLTSTTEWNTSSVMFIATICSHLCRLWPTVTTQPLGTKCQQNRRRIGFRLLFSLCLRTQASRDGRIANAQHSFYYYSAVLLMLRLCYAYVISMLSFICLYLKNVYLRMWSYWALYAYHNIIIFIWQAKGQTNDFETVSTAMYFY